MTPYNHKKIEGRWQKVWEKKGIYRSREGKGKKAYVLDMFPYPSGEGLHVGHPKGYIATDIYSRQARMGGKNVLHPMGWDAFGLPAENFAIKNKIHPRKAVEKNIKRFKEQLRMIGLDYDWKREINTTDPAYYKWTQWIFLQLYKKGLAYQSFEPINWCPSCQTGLANEDLDGLNCERCGTLVEKRPMRQWTLKITDYADRLLKDLDLLPEWQEHIKESQRNWIGKSEGAEILFPLSFDKTWGKKKFVLLHGFKGSPAAYDWLKSQLEHLGHKVVVPTLPNPNAPTERTWVEAALGATTYDENTVLLGYSLGAVTALKVIEKIETKIAGLVLAGGFVDPEFKDAPRNFATKFDWTFDAKIIRSKVGFVHLLHDTTDTAISEDQARRLSETLGTPLTYVRAQEPHFCGEKELVLLNYLVPSLKVFTTRPDTLYGATYMVLAPEHPWVTLALTHKGLLKNEDDVRKYIIAAKAKTEIERQENKDKTGVELEGVEAINPATGAKIPVFIADYVLANYGTGAIMAVPAHDERDHAFAKKFGLPIKDVIIPRVVDSTNPHQPGKKVVFRKAIVGIVRNKKTGKYLVLKWKNQPWTTFITGGIEDGEDAVEAARREIAEETGYSNVSLVRVLGTPIQSEFFAAHKDINRVALVTAVLFELDDETRKEVAPDELEKHDIAWLDRKDITRDRMQYAELPITMPRIDTGDDLYTDLGVLINSGDLDGLDSEAAKTAMTQKYGVAKTTYKLRDWVFSRQRYWGEPIPIIHCDKCGIVPVPEKDLPVTLPEVKNYAPTGTGESPLAAINKWVNVKCPTCKGKAKRETNTMPQWAGSSWYYLRYMDPHNKKALVDKKKEKYWAPVDIYVGGAEHATRHLIYARFWHKFLYDIKVVSTPEPFIRLISVGLIQAEDGRKMSKRFGNVINPDTIVKQFGADTLRVYEMFMGPFTDAIAWNTNSMVGSRRFIERVWKLQASIIAKPDVETERLSHQTTKKVTEDIAAFKFNTAISSMMIFVNAAEKTGLTQKQYLTFLQLLAPFAPHITEELWSQLKQKGSIHVSKWPTHNPKLLVADTATFVVQINGKMRGQLELPVSASEQDVVAAAYAHESLQQYLKGEVVKVIFIPGKLVSFVVKN